MSLASNLARSVKVELIAKLATSYEAYDGGTLIKNVAPHNVRDYFRKYGNTARKYDHIENDDIYVGYVRMSDRPEFLSAIVLAGAHAVAVSFDSETDDSNDFLTLMAKKEFAERMTAAVQHASAIMRKAAAPTPVATPAAPQPTVKKKDASLGWTLAAVIGVLMGASLVIPTLTGLTTREAAPPTSGFNLEDSYNESGPQYSAAPPVSTDIPQGYEQRGSVIEGVTLGMADAIMSGIDEFNAAYSAEGMTGATSKSMECFDRAKSSSSIFDIDRCAAFDFAAQSLDNEVSGSLGLPRIEYFEKTNERLKQAYSRFSDNYIQRMSIVKGQTAIVIRDTSN